MRDMPNIFQLNKKVLEQIAADVNGTIDTAALDLVKHKCDAMVPVAVMVPGVNGTNATCQVVYEKGKIPCKKMHKICFCGIKDN